MCKEFILTVFVKSARGPHEVSLFDVKNSRVFLKKGIYDQDGPIRLQDLHINGSVTVCSRRFKILEYADTATREVFQASCDQVYTLIGADAVFELGVLLTAAVAAGLTVKRIKSVKRPHSGLCVAMELVGNDAVNSWMEAVKGAASPAAAALVTAERATADSERVFESKESTAKCSQCSLCIIRPHAMKEGQAGEVLDALRGAGLEISALQTYSLLKSQAEMFYEVYKTVLPSAQYHAMINELSSGLCLAVEVRCEGEDAVTVLRDLCGPYDVEIARHLRPKTLRARLGRDAVHNCVHCTDLPEDGVLECQYFFDILPNAGAN